MASTDAEVAKIQAATLEKKYSGSNLRMTLKLLMGSSNFPVPIGLTRRTHLKNFEWQSSKPRRGRPQIQMVYDTAHTSTAVTRE